MRCNQSSSLIFFVICCFAYSIILYAWVTPVLMLQLQLSEHSFDYCQLKERRVRYKMLPEASSPS